MKLQILNKNLTTSSYTSAKIFEIAEGSVFIETKNETLDSGTAILDNQETPIQIAPYDIVAIYKNDGTFWKYMCVDTYTEQMFCVNPKLYKYEITLFSETKLLEGIILPNLKITKVPNIVRSIFYYISQYMSEYGTQIRIPDSTEEYSYVFTDKWTTDWDDHDFEHPKLEVKFGDECPEMQWNTPTLREVLNDLMMVKDCIPILKNGRLDYLDLTETPETNRNLSDITNDSHINYVAKSKSSEDYVSELQMTMKNVTNVIDGSNNLVTTVEFVPFTTDEGEPSLNTKNAYIKTKYPIYNLKHLWMVFPANIDGGILTYVRQDLCNLPFNFVTEYKEWLLKPVSYPSIEQNYDLGEAQNLSIYYTRGEREIKGFFAKEHIFLWMNSTLLDQLTKYLSKLYSVLPSWTGDTTKYYKVMFEIEYETLEGCLFRASKNDDVEHDRIVIDNQTNSYVDSYNQGFLEYQKANRLGNEQLHINIRYPSTFTGHIASIGDVYGDCIVYQCEYQNYRDHIEVNALATKNYILREYFTGVKSKIRSWVIASGDEALERYDINKKYCEFSYRPHNIDCPETATMGFLNINGQYFASPLTSFSAEPLRYVAVSCDTEYAPYHLPEEVNIHDSGRQAYYVLDLISRIVGNSLVFTYGFDDNWTVSKSINTDIINLDNNSISNDGVIDWADTATVNGEPLTVYGYADNYGELNFVRAIFGSEFRTIPGIDGYYENLPLLNGITFIGSYTDYRKQFDYYCFLRPRVLERSIYDPNAQYEDSYDFRKFASYFSHHKDSQEIIKMSTQIEFNSDTTDICFTKERLKRQIAVKRTDSEIVLEIDGYQLFPNQKFDYRRPDQYPIQYLTRATDYVTVELAEYEDDTDSIVTEIKIMSPAVFDTAEEAEQFFLDRLDYAWYLNVKSDDGGQTEYNDREEPVLLSFSNIPPENIHSEQDGAKYKAYISLYMNMLASKNKNIYDSENHYLIVDKI